jgi:hypothetical protein
MVCWGFPSLSFISDPVCLPIFFSSLPTSPFYSLPLFSLWLIITPTLLVRFSFPTRLHKDTGPSDRANAPIHYRTLNGEGVEEVAGCVPERNDWRRDGYGKDPNPALCCLFTFRGKKRGGEKGGTGNITKAQR